MKLYVGNLPLNNFSEADLKSLFSSYASVISCRPIFDRETKRFKGFGFVEFSDKDEAEQAIKDLNGKEVGGRKLVVNEARPQEPRPQDGNSRRSFNNGPSRRSY
ncbi:MAG: RNA-binding protein [Chlamydiae bacterium]|nr:RNA-binding protein [Chlamydiota bacterium]